MPERSDSTIRPSNRAGSLPEDPIDRRWRAGPGVRSTSRMYQAWKTVVVDGKPVPFTCPKCGEVILNLPVHDDAVRWHCAGTCGGMSAVITCENCGWIPADMTPAERAEMEAQDPEMIPVFQYLERMEQYTPRFEGHANLKQMSGKERRERRLRSNCAYAGGV